MTDRSSPPSDVKALWRDQPHEPAPVNLEDIRRKALRFQRRRRIVNSVEYVSSALVVVMFALYVRYLPGITVKVASLYGIGWAVYAVWQRHRLMSARPLPEDAAACLDFHRRELQRQYDAVRSAWRWLLAPIAPLMILMLLGRLFETPAIGRPLWLDRVIIVIAFAVMTETMVLCWLWMQNRADKLQDQIDELDGPGSRRP